MKTAIEYGVKEPKWNGWTANSMTQGDFRPVYNLKYILNGQSVRFVSVLLPQGDVENVLVGVEASMKPEDTKIILRLEGDKELCLDEKELFA